jgi:dihydrofolate reductase
MKNDPKEWTNLTTDAKYAALKKSMAKWIPVFKRSPAPGSKHRILTHNQTNTTREGNKTNDSDSIPEID